MWCLFNGFGFARGWGECGVAPAYAGASFCRRTSTQVQPSRTRGPDDAKAYLRAAAIYDALRTWAGDWVPPSCARRAPAPHGGRGPPSPPLTGSLSGVRQARTAHERWSQAREPAESGVMTPRQGSARRLGRWAGSCMSGELRHGGGGGAGACHTREANPPPDRGPLGREVRRTVAELR